MHIIVEKALVSQILSLAFLPSSCSPSFSLLSALPFYFPLTENLIFIQSYNGLFLVFLNEDILWVLVKSLCDLSPLLWVKPKLCEIIQWTCYPTSALQCFSFPYPPAGLPSTLPFSVFLVTLFMLFINSSYHLP